MTKFVYDDGPFVRGYGAASEEYFLKRWVLRCDGERVLGPDRLPDACWVMSDGFFEPSKIDALRGAAAEEGWAYGTFDRRRVDICPACKSAIDAIIRREEQRGGDL